MSGRVFLAGLFPMICVALGLLMGDLACRLQVDVHGEVDHVVVYPDAAPCDASTDAPDGG